MNLRKIGKIFTSKFVGTGPSSYEKKEFTGTAVSQGLRNTAVQNPKPIQLRAVTYFTTFSLEPKKFISVLTKAHLGSVFCPR